MVRKKMKRICSAACAALVLALCVVPVLLMSGSAMVISGEDPADVYVWPVPLNVFTNHIYGISVDNPLWRVAGPSGVNHKVSVDTSFLDDVYGVLGSWRFESSFSNELPLDKGFYQNKILLDAAESINSFGFRNSSDFVANTETVYDFLTNFCVTVPPGMDYEIRLYMRYKYPLMRSDGSYELKTKIYEDTFSVYNESETEPFLFESVFSTLDLFGFYNDNYVFSDAYFLDFSVDFDVCFNSNCNPDYYGSGTNGLEFSCCAYSVDSLMTLEDFRERYPGVIYNFGSAEGVAGGFLDSLKVGIGGFMETEIIPGLSFGGMLATGIGISLVLAFIRIFGG